MSELEKICKVFGITKEELLKKIERSIENEHGGQSKGSMAGAS